MKIKKIVSGSFLLIMAIHIVVFATIGFLSQEWGLLLLFLSVAALLGLIGWFLRTYSKRHPEKRRLHSFLSMLWLKK
jgi:predicted membrane channel-forming protein YqfA (hemolysin III family)